MKVKFYGTRGSIPVPEKDFMEFGGNTACVLVTFDNGRQAILDAGSGIRKLGKELLNASAPQSDGVIILSHTHWDHIQGFPFFTPAYLSSNHFTIYLGSRPNSLPNLAEIFANQMKSEYFPVGLEALPANLRFMEPKQEQSVTDWGAIVTSCQLSHPGDCYGYRFEYNGKTLVYCTDVEYIEEINPKVVRLAKNADLLIHDAQYTPEELRSRKGWGHSSWTQAVEVAQQAGVKTLALFHHDPDHDDDFLRNLESQCQQVFPHSFFAREGSEFEW
jgi:phosphoribosyl 1,2-cyclic phosphodiesterase